MRPGDIDTPPPQPPIENTYPELLASPLPATPSAAEATYPYAIQAHAHGPVNVQVLIDETGKVVSARAVSGHPLLMAAAQQAAYRAVFSPTTLGGQAVKASGVIPYNFILP